MEAAINTFFRSFNSKIEDPVRQHLKNVYACLTLSTILASVGAYIHIFTNIMSAGLFSVIAAVGLLIALTTTPDSDKNRKLRLGYLLGFAFFTGLGMGPIVDYSISIDPSLVLTALLATSLIFAAFTLSALFAKRGYFLFLAAPLMTLLSSLMVLSIANVFFGSLLLFQVQLYLGLLAMCGFVLFDTCVIIEKRRMGDKDFVGHSIDLFIDFIGIFKRILVILTQKAEDNDRRRRRN